MMLEDHALKQHRRWHPDGGLEGVNATHNAAAFKVLLQELISLFCRKK